MVLIWFVTLSLSFSFLGGFINGLSGSTVNDPAVIILSLVVLAYFISSLGVYKQLLPGTRW